MALRHYGYKLVDAQSAWVWNITGACVMACLVIWVIWRLKSRLAAFVGLWWIAEEAMVAGCGALWILNPWPIRPGQDVCYPLLEFDLGKIGVLMLAILLFKLRRA